MKTKISWYGQFVVLPDEVKRRNNIKVGPAIPRLDCIKSAGYYKGIEPCINNKGLFKFDLLRTDNIKADGQRKADYWLQTKIGNFSSMYPTGFSSNPLIFFGEPNNKKTIRKSKTVNKKRVQIDIPNPMYPFKNDGYIFICNKELTQIEVLVIEDARYLINAYCKQFVNGGFDEQLKILRETASIFYNY